MLKLVGSNSGTITGSISNILSSTNQVRMNTQSLAIGGDSGGPVFKSSTGARNTFTSEILGIAFNSVVRSHGNTHITCEPVDKIMSELNLRPHH